MTNETETTNKKWGAVGLFLCTTTSSTSMRRF